MSTARDLITGSLRLIGVIARGESLSAEDANDGLVALNRMISSWSTQRLMIPSTTEELFTLIPSQQTYAFGTGGDFDSARPIQVEGINIQEQTSPNLVEYKVKLITQEEWEAIPARTIQSPLPVVAYIDGAFPNQNINFFPVPNFANKAKIWSWKELTQIASLDTVISMPPAYEEAIQYNLSIKLAPEYGRPAPQEVVTVAVQGMEDIKRANFKPKVLAMDPALTAGKRHFNIITGR